MKLIVCLAAVVLVASLPACGGNDDSTSTNDGNAPSPKSSGAVEMVPLSSLGLDLPFELSYDPPVPSDATVASAVIREASAATHAGYDLTLDTSATYEDVKAAYDEFMGGLAMHSALPESQAWSGRRGEGEPGLTIAFFGGRLNIAEILDN